MNILVTGGTSTLGKHLKQFLPDAVYLSSKDCNLIDYKSTLKTFSSYNPDIVIHLAALVGGIKDNISRPVEYLENNIYINTNVIKCAYKVGVKKLIALSSTCIYPDNHPIYPMKEQHMFDGPPTSTSFYYAYSKRCMVSQIDAYNKQYNTEYCYISPSNLYSELDTHRLERAHFITALINKVINQEKIKSTQVNLIGTGKATRQFTYAGDVAKLIKMMIDNNIYQSFNVSNPQIISINDLAKDILKILNKEDWKIKYKYPEMDGQLKRAVSIDKMMALFPDFTFTEFGDIIKLIYNQMKTNIK